MNKTISVISTGDDNKEISNNNHVVDLLLNIKSKNLSFVKNSKNSDATFVLHSFSGYSDFTKFLNTQKNKSVFVYPIEMADDELIKTTFNHPAINKIILASEYYQKYFTKNLGFPTSSVRLIYTPVKDYRPIYDKKNNLNKRVVITPASVRPEKDFISLIEAMGHLKTKYNNFHYIILLSKHPSITEEEYQSLTGNMIELVAKYFKSNEVSFITNQKLDYKDYLDLAQVVLLPYDNSNRMYLNALWDSIVAGKSIVMPENNLTKDLIKRDMGGLLYQNDNIQSIIDTCGLLLDNEDISSILVKQNALIAKNYLESNITSQYINLFRRIKE